MKSVYLASSVQDLATLAEKSLPPIDNNTKLVLYFRSAQQILMQANIYKREGDFEKAYIHMLKYSILILEKLPRHTQYNLPEVLKERDTAKKMVLKLLDDLEGMKLVLKKLYADEEAQKKKLAEEQVALELEMERKRKQEESERAAQEAQFRAEQEEQRRKEEEQQREWQMELFARQQLLAQNNSSADNPTVTTVTPTVNNGILIPTPAASVASLSSNTGIGGGADIVDPLLGPMQGLQLNNLNLQQAPHPFDGSSSSEPQALPQDFFLQQQLLQQQQQQQQQLMQYASAPPPLSPSPSPSLPFDSTMPAMAVPPQPSAPPAPPSVVPPTPDFLTPQELPPPAPYPSTGSSGQQPLVDISPDIYAPPRDSFHNLNSLGPTSSTVATTVKNEPEASVKASVAYPDLYKHDPMPPRSSATSNYKYTPPLSNISSARMGNPASPALPPVYSQQHFPPPPSPSPSLTTPTPPPIQAAQHQLQYAPPLPNFMPLPTYPHPPVSYSRHVQPPSYKQPPAATAPVPYSAPPAASRAAAAQPKVPPTTAPPPNTTTRTPIPQAYNSTLSNKKELEVSPVEAMGPSKPRNTGGLRKMVVYGEMFAAFMKVAHSNTSRQIETCAILSGTLLKDVFYVTTMIVPKQEGTRDTCVTKNEEELFEYQMSKDLLTLGWIHTHPTQDCFMSSVDLHTHCTYQLLLPEAIAVVISPMFTPNFGLFRVSDPPGMQIIQNCNQRGFHQHADTLGKTLYTLCDHVDLVWGQTNNFKVVDLR